MAKSFGTQSAVIAQMTSEDVRWDPGGTVTWVLPQTYPSVESSLPQYSGAQLISTAETNAIPLALQAWADVANIHFVQGTDNGSLAGKISFFASSSLSSNEWGQTAIGSPTSTYTSDGRGVLSTASYDTVWVNASQVSAAADGGGSFSYGTYNYMSLLHEIGHSLGLAHPGNYDASSGTPTYDNNAFYGQDTQQYTVMSYFSETNTGANYTNSVSHVVSHPQTPMVYDILAIQSLYGANTSTRSGDTVYGFNSNTGSSIYNFSQNTNPVLTIYDTGGNDTLDLSGYSVLYPANVNLNQGQYSSVGGMVDNIGIAYGTDIENVVGTQGNDTILGNALNNNFYASNGTDSITGGGGIDTMIFSAAHTVYTVKGGFAHTTVSLNGSVIDNLYDVDKIQFSDLTEFNTGSARQNDVNGDGQADILWQGTGGGAVNSWLNQGTVLSTHAYSYSPFDLSSLLVKGVAYSDSDAYADFIYEDDVAHVLDRMHNDSSNPSNGASGYGKGGDSNTATATFSAGWHLVAAADFTGTGVSSLLMQNDDGRVTIWDGTSPLTNPSASNLIQAAGTGWNVVGIGDFDDDGKADILEENGSGQILWASVASSAYLGSTSDTSWKVVGTGDVNGDGNSDILWQNSNGQVAVWLINGSNIVSEAIVGNNTDPEWVLKGATDINGDGTDDLMFQYGVAGQVAYWEMNGTAIIGTGTIAAPDTKSYYELANFGVGAVAPVRDFGADANGDRHPDLFWQNQVGQASVWLLNGASVQATALLGATPGLNWNLVGMGKLSTSYSSTLFWQSDTGQVAYWNLNGTTIGSETLLGSNPGSSWHLRAIGNFDNDINNSNNVLSDLVWESDSGQVEFWMDGATTGAVLGTADPSWKVVATGDFNGDSDDDLLWQNSSGQAAIWLMHGTAITVATAVGANQGPTWHIKASGDFNNDGYADILWQNDNGQAAIWLMDGTTVKSTTSLANNPGTGWSIVGVGDVNGDGNSDILWESSVGQAAVWYMNGTTTIGSDLIGTAAAGWSVANDGNSKRPANRGDFNNDGYGDLVWQNDSGQAAIWEMNGSNAIVSAIVGNNGDPNWRIKGQGDFNRDGNSDLIWQNGLTGQAAIWFMSGTTVVSSSAIGNAPGASWHVAAVGDLDADGNSDIVWQNDSGQVAVWYMNGSTVVGAPLIGNNPGAAWKIAGTGDFNGDGTSDLLWQNSSTGQAVIWFMNGSAVLSTANIGASPGTAWHIRATGDFSDDGYTDIVWQNDSGQAAIWFMAGSNILAQPLVGAVPGAGWTVKAAADVNGDGFSDLIWQNSTSGQAAVWLMSGPSILSQQLVGSAAGATWHVVTG